MRQATEQDIDRVTAIYNEIIDYLETQPINYPGWSRGCYPLREDAVSAQQEGTLFVAEEGEDIVASIVLNSTPEPGYQGAPWQAELDHTQVLVIHTFVVSPRRHKEGLGRLMLDFAENHAKKGGLKAIRLDTYRKNTPAMGLYEKCGYKYIATISLGMEAYGLDLFRLYEKLL